MINQRRNDDDKVYKFKKFLFRRVTLKKINASFFIVIMLSVTEGIDATADSEPTPKSRKYQC